MSIDLSNLNINIAVTGLKTGDNPQPGVPVIRSIRNAGFKGKIVGLVYDSLESGIFYEGLADMIFQMPFPSSGSEIFLARLDYILTRVKIDVIIPTLDSEVIVYIRLKDELLKRGIHTFIPTEEQFILRDKTKLSTFFPEKGINVPQTLFMTDPNQAYTLSQVMDFPVYVKGKFYEAYKANSAQEVVKYFHDIESKWGLPIIVQKHVPGDEFNVVFIGDGEGGVLGMIPQRKIVITDKGKGFGGVVVNNPGLDEFSAQIIKALKWRGPGELEIMRGFDEKFYLIEINPRFPAWVRLAEGAGQNLPAAVVKLALGEPVEKMTTYKPGTLFIRHAEDIISDISVMGAVSTNGELINQE